MYYGDSYADKATMRLEGKIKRIYAEAYSDIEKKLNNFTRKSALKEEYYKSKVQSGEMTQQELDQWKQGQVFIGKRWKDLRQNISEEMYHTRVSATDMINNERKAVFQDNVNYTMYDIDKDFRFGISFTLYDEATVTRLIKEDPDLVPDVKYPDPNIDYAWSKKQIASAITQGVLQGESIPQLAKRIGKKLSSSNEKSMVRCARTAMTGAQNSGRIEAMHNAQDMGIKVQKLWISTLDNRTRDSHQHLDGQVQDVDKPFISLLGEIMFPGDPDAKPADIWNCRCSLGWEYPDYKNENIQRRARTEDKQNEVIEYMTYKEWEKWVTDGKPQRIDNVPASETQIVQGKNISETWTRRSNKFAYEIEDVINAQGFDGKPRVVNAKEFEILVSQANNGNGLIAQRVYSASSQEVLDSYRNQLYDGKWYVDCSKGGKMFGQGMYCAADFSGNLSKNITTVMDEFKDNGVKNSTFSYVETMTLDKSAKIAQYFDFIDKWNGTFTEKDSKEAQEKGIGFFDAFSKRQKEGQELRDKYGDINAWIASQGYDAVVCGDESESGVFLVVLNRTKLVIKGEEK